MKGGEEVTLREPVTSIQSRGEKLCVIDGAATLHIDAAYCDVQVIPQLVVDVPPLQALAELIHGQDAVAISVHGEEHLAQAPHLLVTQLARDDLEGRLLQPILLVEGAQVVDGRAGETRCRRVGCLAPKPNVLQGLLGGEARLRVHVHQHAHQVLRVRGDIPPRSALQGVFGLADFGQDLLASLPGERRFPAEQRVHDRPTTP
mmetsp:Transcript_93839/g.270366  ORF Transcript_93839/g.270366 Transcript_93839/m.270366 type:complete len:203 (-) Transcript_93839:547-1155(-)